MDCQENFEMYLNLSRKELQGLCKSNYLPANRSKTELAQSLASFFKQNVHPAPSKERLNSPVESTFSKSFVQDTKSKETSENNNKGEYEERENIQDSDSHKVGGDCRQHSTSGKQMEIISHVDGQTAENAYNIVVNAFCPNTESPHVFALTTFGAGNGCPVTDGQLNSNCDTDRPNSQLYKLPELIKQGQKLLNYAVPNSEVHNIASVRNSQPKAADCYPEGILSPERNATNATPSFQFFVASDEGIDLHVDLNSSPLEWIRGLKYGVSETLDPQHHKSTILPNHTEELVAVNGCLETLQVGNIEINRQSNGERSSGCTTSTLSSVSEICQSEGCQPDATVVSSESSVLTSVIPTVEMSGGLDGNRVISSFCATHSNDQKIMTNNIACPRNGNSLPQNLVDASLRIDKCNTLQLGTSVKPFGNAGILSLEETRKPKEPECPILSNAVDGSNNVEAKVFSHTPASSFKENKLLKHEEIEKHVSTSENLDNDNASCPDSGETGPNEGSSEVPGSHLRSPSASELGRQLLLDYSVTEVQSDAASADDLLTLHASIHGSLTVKDPVATLNDGLVKRTPVKEIKCSSYRISKRSHSPEVNEEIQHKRHQPDDENNSGMVVNLRTARTSAKDTISEEVLRPRRSTRLHAKVFSNFPLIAFILWFLVYIGTKRMF